MTIHNVLNLRDDLDISKKDSPNIENNVVVSIQGLEDNIKNKERLITATRNSAENIRTNRSTKTKKRKG